jgi:hypothetical protein
LASAQTREKYGKGIKKEKEIVGGIVDSFCY